MVMFYGSFAPAPPKAVKYLLIFNTRTSIFDNNNFRIKPCPLAPPLTLLPGLANGQAEIMASSKSVSLATSGRRGRRRSPAADEAILSATREILVSSGTSGFSIKEVVERSGVSTATIYRRWPAAHDLILEGIRSLVPEPLAIDAGSLETDITAFISQFGDALLSVAGLYAADMHNSGTDASLAEEIRNSFVEPRLQLMGAILERAQGRGELGLLPDIEECWDFIAGPIHHRLLIREESFTAEYAALASAVIIAGLAVLSSQITGKKVR